MKVELKNLKIHPDMSEETTCFSATVYIDGKRAAQAKNDGRGGDSYFHFQDRALEKRFHEFCASQPPLPPSHGFDRPLSMDADLYVSMLLERTEIQQQISRWCRKNTIFRLKGDQKGWRTVKSPYTQAVKDFLVKKYGDQLECIANENLDQAVDIELRKAA